MDAEGAGKLPVERAFHSLSPLHVDGAAHPDEAGCDGPSGDVMSPTILPTEWPRSFMSFRIGRAWKMGEAKVAVARRKLMSSDSMVCILAVCVRVFFVSTVAGLNEGPAIVKGERL